MRPGLVISHQKRKIATSRSSWQVTNFVFD